MTFARERQNPVSARSVTIGNLKGRDLPGDWAQRAGLGPDDAVDVVLRPSAARPGAQAMASLTRLGESLRAAGVTEADLRREFPDLPEALLKA